MKIGYNMKRVITKCDACGKDETNPVNCEAPSMKWSHFFTYDPQKNYDICPECTVKIERIIKECIHD
jgi:hypothetical protein